MHLVIACVGIAYVPKPQLHTYPTSSSRGSRHNDEFLIQLVKSARLNYGKSWLINIYASEALINTVLRLHKVKYQVYTYV